MEFIVISAILGTTLLNTIEHERLRAKVDWNIIFFDFKKNTKAVIARLMTEMDTLNSALEGGDNKKFTMETLGNERKSREK